MREGKKRLIIEKDCWCLMIEMAVHGHSRFKPGMTRLLSKWMALLDEDDVELKEPPTVLDGRGWAQELPMNQKLVEDQQRVDLLFSKALVALATTNQQKLSTLPYSDPKWIEDESRSILAKPAESSVEEDDSAANTNPSAGAGDDDGRRKSGRQTKEPARGVTTITSIAELPKKSKKRSRKNGGQSTKKRKVSKSGRHVSSDSDDSDSDSDGDIDDVKPVFSLPTPQEVAAPEV